MKVWQWLAQALCFVAFMAFIGLFSNSPPYRHLAADQATIKLSLRHAGQILGQCRERSPEELAQLPPNMRIAEVCPRERSPLLLELLLDDVLVLSKVLPARGLHRDGRASAYERLTVPAGATRVTVRMKDHIEAEDFQYTASRSLHLPAGGNLVIDFNEEARAFEFRLPVSGEGSALQEALNDLEAGDGEDQDHDEVDERAVGQRFAAALLDHPHDPVGEEIEPDRHDGE